MKKSTLKLLIFTFIGILTAYSLYIIENNISSFSRILQPRVVGKMNVGIYIAPFIGLGYWLFAKNLED